LSIFSIRNLGQVTNFLDRIEIDCLMNFGTKPHLNVQNLKCYKL